MIEAYQPLVETLKASLTKLAAKFDKKPLELYEPQKYILSLGGKRIRPLLALIACDLYNQDVKKAIPSTHALELFHNFSLIHDDIMDNAPLRRGKQTIHEKWNANVAILSGDSMLVQAYESLAESDAEKLPQLLKIFTKTAHEVCEGQQLDMNFENRSDVSLEEYTHMISLKTAVLLGCSLQMGAIVAGASKEDQHALYTFGKELGIAFQLHDDLLDAYSDNTEFGKQIGGDIIANKKTFLLIKTLEIANSQQKQSLYTWLSKTNFDNAEKIAAIKKVYDELSIKTICETEIKKHYSSAIKKIDQLSCDKTKKNNLVLFSENLMNREY